MENGSVDNPKRKPSLVFLLVYTLLTIVALLPYAPLFVNDNNVISWKEADKHMDDGIYSVEGEIAGVKYAKDETGHPIFIDIGKPYPEYGRTVLVIWEENQKHFKKSPTEIAKYYKSRIGETVTAAGYIDYYDNHTEIKISYPQQIGVDGKKAQKHFMRFLPLAALMFLVYTVYLGMFLGVLRNLDDTMHEGALFKVANVYYICLGAIVVGKLLYIMFLK